MKREVEVCRRVGVGGVGVPTTVKNAITAGVDSWPYPSWYLAGLPALKGCPGTHGHTGTYVVNSTTPAPLGEVMCSAEVIC